MPILEGKLKKIRKYGALRYNGKVIENKNMQEEIERD